VKRSTVPHRADPQCDANRSACLDAALPCSPRAAPGVLQPGSSVRRAQTVLSCRAGAID
jgi:hypothetical protein